MYPTVGPTVDAVGIGSGERNHQARAGAGAEARASNVVCRTSHPDICRARPASSPRNESCTPSALRRGAAPTSGKPPRTLRRVRGPRGSCLTIHSGSSVSKTSRFRPAPAKPFSTTRTWVSDSASKPSGPDRMTLALPSLTATTVSVAATSAAAGVEAHDRPGAGVRDEQRSARQYQSVGAEAPASSVAPGASEGEGGTSPLGRSVNSRHGRQGRIGLKYIGSKRRALGTRAPAVTFGGRGRTRSPRMIPRLAVYEFCGARRAPRRLSASAAT